jgi:hypothetical protein
VASLTDKNHRASRVSSVYGADEKGNPLFMNAAEPSSCARPPSHPIQRVRVPTLLANIDDAEQEDSQDGKDPFGD